MKTIFNIVLFAAILFNFNLLKAQNTITIITDCDATLGDHDNYNSANRNYETANSNAAFILPGYSGGIQVCRSVMKFDLSSIPPGAIITSAKLNLYVINIWGSDNSRTGHAGTNNSSVLQRITSNWQENTVTWNTQPSTTTQNQVELPQSTYPLQDYLDIDVTSLTQDMLIENNYGFILKLVTEETPSNALVFCSSDYEDSSKHPRLEITYIMPNNVPIANSGNDQIVNEGDLVTLDGSASFDQDGNSLTYLWTSPQGITLSSNNSVKPTFIAPQVDTNTEYKFYLVVNNGKQNSHLDSVIISVKSINNPVLNVSANTVYVARGYGSTASVDVTSNIAWNAASDQTWLWVSPKSGSGNMSLEFTANSANPKITTRSATVTVSGEGVPTQQIRVIQAAGDTILTVTDTNLNIGYAEGSRVWTGVTSNTIWRVESDQLWLTPNPASSEGNKNLIFTANENPNGFPRTATITVMALGSETKTITITQVAKPVLNLMTDTIYISKEEGSTAEITVSANVGWRAVSEQEWLTCSPDSGTYDGTVTVTATANPGVGKRSSVVSISGVGVGIKRVTVIQREGDPVLVVSPDSVIVEKEEGSTAEVNITSNTNWDAVSDQPWLEVNPVTSTGSGELIVTAAANPTIAERTAIVTVSELGVAPQQIVVTQAAGDPVITISGEMISIGAEEDSKATMNVISNTSWAASTDQTWLTLSPLTGTGNGSITLTAKANPSTNDRPAHLTITDGKGTSQTIVVVQLAGHVGNIAISIGNVSLYPNPVSEGFQLKGLEGRAELIVTDLRGAILISKEIDGNEYVSTILLAKGMYIVRITNSEGRVEKKLIKQ